MNFLKRGGTPTGPKERGIVWPGLALPAVSHYLGRYKSHPCFYVLSPPIFNSKHDECHRVLGGVLWGPDDVLNLWRIP